MTGLDEKEFFREFTLRICGSLQIDKALYRCLRYASTVIPVDTLLLTFYDAASGSVEIVSAADEHGWSSPHLKTPIPPEIRTRIESEDTEPAVRITDDVMDDEVGALIARHAGVENRSVLIGRLVLDGKYVGSLTACARGRGRFTSHHARLWALVNEPAAIALANSLQYRELSRIRNLLAEDNLYLQQELRREAGETIVGAEEGLRPVMDKIRRVAPLDSPVLLLGETGVGKEVIAHALHDMSNRRGRPFIKVDCGAIPESLIDSELFGHERGAFTGAEARKRGRFERAHTGTIFLDEIGELPLQAQTRLLRVLQSGNIERVGGNEPVALDIRVVAATHRDLDRMVAENRFRKDLIFRLNVYPIRIPPLRERRRDIPMLVDHFIRLKARALGIRDLPKPSPDGVDRLIAHDWPGNIRELENAVERTLIESRGSKNGRRLHFESFGRESRPQPPSPSAEAGNPQGCPTLDEATASHIRHALSLSGGKINGPGGAAERLDVHPNTLRSKMDRLGLSYRRRR